MQKCSKCEETKESGKCVCLGGHWYTPAQCKKTCAMPKDKSKIKTNVWEEGDEGLKYKWNKVGELKDYSFICEVCGNEQHFMPL